MWAPDYQTLEDRAVLWAAIAQWSFATLVSSDADGVPSATLAPFIVREGRLWAHLAAANPHARLVAPDRPLLCHFTGPHAYVSPSWYEDPGHVPTWNYAQVQVAGRPRLLDRDDARWVVAETVREHESRRPVPVGFDSMTGMAEKLLSGIVAFEVLIDGMLGRFKLSQNKSDRDRSSVAGALRAGDETERAVAELMTSSEWTGDDAPPRPGP